MWVEVRGYKGRYEINREGAVRSISYGRQRIVRSHKSKLGYVRIPLFDGKKQKLLLLHRLIAEAFIPKREGCNEVNHINMNKSDNRVENLEWVNKIENGCHRTIGKKTSRYAGVNFCKTRGKWVAQISINNKKKSIGVFLTEEEAHNARVSFEVKNGITNKYSQV